MPFNPDSSKQAHLFNNLPLRHLRIHFDEEVTFKHHINKKNNKANKDIEIIRKFNNIFLATLH